MYFKDFSRRDLIEYVAVGSLLFVLVGFVDLSLPTIILSILLAYTHEQTIKQRIQIRKLNVNIEKNSE